MALEADMILDTGAYATIWSGLSRTVVHLTGPYDSTY